MCLARRSNGRTVKAGTRFAVLSRQGIETRRSESAMEELQKTPALPVSGEDGTGQR
jgi:hypothetical protein